MNLQNEAAAGIAEAVIKALPDFEARRRGKDARAIFVTLAHVFPEDAHRINAGLQDLQRGLQATTAQTRPGSGGSKDATPPVKVITAAGIPDCPDCPKPGGGMIGSHRNDTSHLHTPGGVLETFGEDFEMLSQHAKARGINIGRSTKPRTIARKVAHYYRTQASKNEEE